MKINWRVDEPGLLILEEIGIETKLEVIPVDKIDRKASSENRARAIPLDETRIDGIRNAMEKGIPMPMIVVRKVGEKYVIAGGNHRFASLKNQREIPVHVIECLDSDFELACRLLNTVVGEGMTQRERVESAVDAIERLGLSRKAAADLYGVTYWAIKSAIVNRIAAQKVKAMPANVQRSFTKSHVIALGDLANNDNVLKAASQAVVSTKLSREELCEIAKVAKSKKTEAAQMAVFRDYAAMNGDCKKAVPRLIKRKFVNALLALESLEDKKTWEALEISEAEQKEFRQKAKRIATYLNSLSKENG
jgi:ParB-like chromosome segregation protein Spo0J